MRRKNIVEEFLKIGSVVLVIALIGVVFLQVFARYCLPSSPSWTEEASRFLFIYAVAFAAPLAVVDKAYVKVEFILDKLSASLQRKLQKGINILLVLFFAIIFIGSISFTRLGFAEDSPAMKLKMVIPFFSITFLYFFMALFYLKRVISDVKNKDNGKKEEN